ncbi:MAG: alpha-L-rhamnosidase C-terminal domain-containing protein, partial [Bacteroidia bacterium]
PITIEAGKGKSADKKYPSELISTAYYYHFTKLMMQFSMVIGEDEDRREFELLGEKIKQAFNQKFYNDRGYYGTNLLTDNVIALYFGMVPSNEVDKVFKNITYTIEVTNKGHLSNGLVGIQWLMRCLNDNGRPDLAYTIATKKTYPSWGYMIDNGATTIWELWNGNTADPKMNSQNHVMMLGDLLIWYYENLAGIKAETAAFKKIVMKPEMIDGLNSVNASYNSSYGLIKSSYGRSDGQFIWNLKIPVNTTALVHIPADSRERVSEKFGDIDKLKFIKIENGRVVYELGSGNYSFLVK